MAGNESTSQTELWSSVVHQPCEEPEESELPSTVDITAFSSGLTVDSNANAAQNNDNSDSESDSEADSSNSASEGCQTSSQSDSSDSESSSSSVESTSRSSSPEFSITNSQTNALRLTIATVRKSSATPPVEKMQKSETTKVNNNKNAGCSSSSDSVCSSESESEEETVTVAKKAVTNKSARESLRRSSNRLRSRALEKKEAKKKELLVKNGGTRSRLRPRKPKKMAASLPLSRTSPYSTSESEDSDADRAILASCSLQEIRQEDLAAILPDQQECDAFGDFECNRMDKSSPQTGDMSSSDMELPQQAVNALIQRTTESSSEGESHAPPNPQTLYANSLLQQFVQQTQMLNAPCPTIPQPVTSAPSTVNNNNNEVNEKKNDENKGDSVKRKRGRPRKTEKQQQPNVSPDSGIQNSPDHVSSPEPTLPTKIKKVEKKTNVPNNTKTVTSNRFDRLLYGNADRVLYPPRRKVGRPPLVKKGPGRPPKQPLNSKSEVDNKKQENRPVLVAKNNKNENKMKFTTLKNLKVMHSRHKHKKHKKYKIRILKSITNDSNKVVIEIDKLVNDFVKFCVIGSTKQPKENIPEVSKTAKKVSKKRKTTDERKKKKISVSTNDKKETALNDQRLPLKKRHYLFSDGKSSVKQETIVEENKTITATTPKKRHRFEINKEKENPTLTFDSPKIKPKLSLESLISELKMKRGLSNRNEKTETQPEMLEAVVKVDNMMLQPEIKTLETPKKKVKKRRAINRTGFPTIKKKKKKVVPVEIKVTEEDTKIDCDRVPKDGEEYNKFIERTEEAMSECDSLPQEERDKSDSGDLDELSLEASIERLRSRLDKKKKKKSLEKIADGLNGYPKRRLRDVSPASSIEPVTERRLRDERASASGDEMRKGKKAPRWRKKYLAAGLFSDYFKEDDETSRMKRTDSTTKSRLSYNPSEHPYGLLPPPYHCGKYLRCRKVAFQLPYDLWWQHTHSQLPGRDVVPSWNYRKIRTNVYNVKTSTGACEPQNCNCTTSSNCGDDCINRLVLAECPANHKCGNQKIQKHEWSPGLEKFMTTNKGWGVRTKLPIKSGDFILEYVGEVVSDSEFKSRMASIYINDTHHYCLHLDGGLVIDGHRMGGDGRFVNHSCEPNCEMQKWSVNGQFRMALFASRDIQANEELAYDYNFSLFNTAEGQVCLCGSEECRGVIGGKSQRVRQLKLEPKLEKNGGRVGRPRKMSKAKKAKERVGEDVKDMKEGIGMGVMKLSHSQKLFIMERKCFLLRNLTKVKKLKEKSSAPTVSRQQSMTPTNQGAAFINHLNALEKPRNMRTRRLAQAEEDPELNKTVKLASVLREIWNTLIKARDEHKELLSAPFMSMPSKRKVPEFYQRISNPIDLNMIEQNIGTGLYLTPENFDADMNRLFTNYLRFYGRTNQVGVAAIKLKKLYSETKQKSLRKFEDVLGKKPAPNFVAKNRNKDEEEDIIRCICGIPRDEGLMIQCERCMVWQHSECVKADVEADSYHCEQCVPRKVDYEIPMDEFTEHGHRYYATLLRGELQLRQGDTVYVLRDIPIPGTDKKHTYDTIGKIEFSELDIFRIERLWKDSKSGQRFAYGHHYLRPHETYHEPTRKFFSNEVMRVPLYEAVPVELIIRHCWVMDINTFCKGRPIGAPEEHIYICEYRVDKSARLFSKVAKSKFPTCTKSFVFERFENRLKITRTYTPHDLDPALVKPRGRQAKDVENESREEFQAPVLPPPTPVIRTPAEQKTRLNKILLNLLSKMPTKQPVDVSYLLEGGRRRKKNVDNNGKS